MKKEIDQIKKRLTNKARSKGIWEYFGQDEVRYLTDKYDVFGTDLSELILDFEDWCETFSLSDI
jgi:hypothetical protein